MNNKQDLTTGTISKKLITYALPLLAINLLQSFYSLMDMLVVDRIVGEAGLAAVSNASMLSFVINSICIGITMSGTILAAQYKGAEDKYGQIEMIGVSFTVAFITTVLVTAASLATYRPFFRLLHIPASAIEDACGYMKVICYRTVFVFGYNTACSIVKELGDSKSPPYFMAVATVIDPVLDLLLVGPFDMGTGGAAYATIFSQGVSLVISMFHLGRKDSVLDSRLSHSSIKTDELAAVLRVDLPIAVQMVSANLSYLLITGMLNQFGVSMAAASGVGLKINMSADTPYWAIGQAVTAMIGQSIGAGNIKHVQGTTNTGLCLDLLITLIVVLLVQIFGEQLILLFTPVSPEILEEEVLYLGICRSANGLVYAAIYTSDSFATGIGSADIVMFNALLGAGIVRLPISQLLAFSLGLGYSGIYIGQALFPFLPTAARLLHFKSKG